MQAVPRRCLTKPNDPVYNNDFDNRLHDYILHVNDTLFDDHGNHYTVLDLLGTGTFGQVVKCRHQNTSDIVAVKVIKNLPAYFNQAWVEINILRMLHRNNSEDDTQHIVKFYSHFVFRGHLCLVFEKLSINLYELLKQNSYVGISLEMLRTFLVQVLDALNVLVESEVIHCDLKPENILLKALDTAQLKIIDFGSACQLHYPVYSYVQSRFYRSPEVLLGAPEYDSKIDMWSIGCVAGELFLGIPLFPGQNEMNMVCRIVEMLGDMPDRFLRRCRHTNKFFNCPRTSDYGIAEIHVYRLKSLSQYEEETEAPLPEWKRFFKEKKLRDIITKCPYRTPAPHLEEVVLRESLVDLLNGMLTIDPRDRWSPAEALQHPFLQGRGLPNGQPWLPLSRSRLLRRSRPVAIEVSNEEDQSPVDEFYSASAPNFTAKGHLNMNTTWGTGAGGQPAGLGRGTGSSQLHHQHHTHTALGSAAFKATQNAGAGVSFAPGSYIPSSTAIMYGPTIATKGERKPLARIRSREDSDQSRLRDHRTWPSSAICSGDRSPQHRRNGAGEVPSTVVSVSTPLSVNSATMKGRSSVQVSGSSESLTGSLQMSGSKESFGIGRTPSECDFGDDPVFPFALDDEAFPLEKTKKYSVYRRQPDRTSSKGVISSALLPPSGPQVSHELSRPIHGLPTEPLSVSYKCLVQNKAVKPATTMPRYASMQDIDDVSVDDIDNGTTTPRKSSRD